MFPILPAAWVVRQAFTPSQAHRPALTSGGYEGYISMEVAPPKPEFEYGVSLYSSAWPLLERPLRDFQIGLASIWIVPDNRSVDYPLLPHGTVARDNWPERGPSYRDVFQTIEGGLGFWANTRFGSSTAKFRMNGTNDGYNHEISSPGWGFGGGEESRALAPDMMGIAQLSSRILVPPDGLTFKKGTCGELLGYAWMALPLAQAKKTTAGLSVATGNQCWTLFLNTQNARGPVAFYTPVTWSRISRGYPPAIGRGLDALPGLVTGGAIEVNTVPRFISSDAEGKSYSRVPRLQFPADGQGRTILIHNLTHYSKQALWNQVESWLAGGPPAAGRFDASGLSVPKCSANPLILTQGDKVKVDGLQSRVETKAFDESTFGLQWRSGALTPWQGGFRMGSLPEYYRQDGKSMIAIDAANVPDETGLKSAEFASAENTETYTSPGPGPDVWRRPGPKAGPFKTKLADGSVVTYYWYRFIDQPSLQDADLSDTDKTRLQAVAEKIQGNWTLSKQYMPPPKFGKLAAIDPGLIVKPPKGLEIGYVPIASEQRG